MLVISRRSQELLVIRDNIVITVFEIGRGKVRLGIEAPADVSVNRGEVHARIQRDKESENGKGAA